MPTASSTLPFISWSESTNAYVVDERGAAYLRGFTNKIAIVVITGRYRSGKSFLMNQLVGSDASEGFSVGHTVESHTKGIWLSTETISATTAGGEAIDVVFMDSEGLGATDKNVQHDTTIFSLAALLCSTLIFNSSGAIDEGSISNLGFIANLTQHIRTKSSSVVSASSSSSSSALSTASSEAPSVSEVSPFLPAFVWVLRDFLLALVDEDGNEISPDEYMEAALADCEGLDTETRSRNKVRKCIRSFFKERRAFTLVRPTEEESDLQSLGVRSPGGSKSLGSSHLRSEFVDGIDVLRAFFFNGGGARAKEIAGRAISGSVLVDLAKSYCASINTGAIPSISDAWDSAAKEELKRIGVLALSSYRAAMTPKKAAAGSGGKTPSQHLLPPFPVSEGALRKAHEAAAADSLNMLLQAFRGLSDPSSSASSSSSSSSSFSSSSQGKVAAASAVAAGSILSSSPALLRFEEQERLQLISKMGEIFAALEADNAAASETACVSVLKSLVQEHLDPAVAEIRASLSAATAVAAAPSASMTAQKAAAASSTTNRKGTPATAAATAPAPPPTDDDDPFAEDFYVPPMAATGGARKSNSATAAAHDDVFGDDFFAEPSNSSVASSTTSAARSKKSPAHGRPASDSDPFSTPFTATVAAASSGVTLEDPFSDDLGPSSSSSSSSASRPPSSSSRADVTSIVSTLSAAYGRLVAAYNAKAVGPRAASVLAKYGVDAYTASLSSALQLAQGSIDAQRVLIEREAHDASRAAVEQLEGELRTERDRAKTAIVKSAEVGAAAAAAEATISSLRKQCESLRQDAATASKKAMREQAEALESLHLSHSQQLSELSDAASKNEEVIVERHRRELAEAVGREKEKGKAAAAAASAAIPQSMSDAAASAASIARLERQHAESEVRFKQMQDAYLATIDSLEAKHEEWAAQVGQLQDALAQSDEAATQERERAEESRQRLEGELERAQTQLASAKAEAAAAAAKVVATKTPTSPSPSTVAELAALRNQVEEAEAKSASLGEELEQMSTMAAELVHESAEHAAAASEARDALARQSTEAAAEAAVLVEAEAARWTTLLAQQKLELEEEHAQELDRVSAASAAAASSSAALAASATEVKAATQKLQAEHTRTLEALNSSLAQKDAALARVQVEHQEDLARVQMEHEEALARVQVEHEEDLARAQVEHEAMLRTTVASWEGRVSELIVEKEALEAVGNEVEESSREELTANSRLLEDARARQREALAELERVKEELTSTKLEAEDSAEALARFREESEGLVAQYASEASSAKDALSTTHARLTSQDTRIADLESALTAAESTSEATAQALSDLQAEADEVAEALAAAREELSTLRSTTATNSATASAANAAIGAHALSESASTQIAEAQSHASAMEAQRDEMATAAATSAMELEAVRAEASALKQKVLDCDETISELTDQLADVKSRYAVAETDLEASEHELQMAKKRIAELSTISAAKAGGSVAAPVKGTAAAAGESGALSRHELATLEGLKLAKAGADKAIDGLTKDLQATVEARDAALLKVADLTTRLTSATTELDSKTKTLLEALSSRDAAYTSSSVSTAQVEQLRQQVQDVQMSAAAAAEAREAELVASRAKVAAAEETSSAAIAIRVSLEKALRAAQLAAADGGAAIADLKEQLQMGTKARNLGDDATDNAKVELKELAKKGTASLRAKDALLLRMVALQHEASLKERRREEISAAIETIVSGAVLIKYKLQKTTFACGEGVCVGLPRFVALVPISHLIPPPLEQLLSDAPAPSPGGGASVPALDEFTKTIISMQHCSSAGEYAISWRELARPRFVKAVRLVDVVGVRLGSDSPIMGRFNEQLLADHVAVGGRARGGAAAEVSTAVPSLEPSRCFSLLLKPDAQLWQDGHRSPLSLAPPDMHSSLDFEASTPAEALVWVFALRCLLLRLAGHDAYPPISPLAIKLERAGLRAQELAKVGGLEHPREYIDLLASEAREATLGHHGGVARPSQDYEGEDEEEDEDEEEEEGEGEEEEHASGRNAGVHSSSNSSSSSSSASAFASTALRGGSFTSAKPTTTATRPSAYQDSDDDEEEEEEDARGGRSAQKNVGKAPAPRPSADDDDDESEDSDSDEGESKTAFRRNLPSAAAAATAAAAAATAAVVTSPSKMGQRSPPPPPPPATSKTSITSPSTAAASKSQATQESNAAAKAVAPVLVQNLLNKATAATTTTTTTASVDASKMSERDMLFSGRSSGTNKVTTSAAAAAAPLSSAANSSAGSAAPSNDRDQLFAGRSGSNSAASPPTPSKTAASSSASTAKSAPPPPPLVNAAPRSSLPTTAPATSTTGAKGVNYKDGGGAGAAAVRASLFGDVKADAKKTYVAPGTYSAKRANQTEEEGRAASAAASSASGKGRDATTTSFSSSSSSSSAATARVPTEAEKRAIAAELAAGGGQVQPAAFVSSSSTNRDAVEEEEDEEEEEEEEEEDEEEEGDNDNDEEDEEEEAPVSRRPASQRGSTKPIGMFGRDDLDDIEDSDDDTPRPTKGGGSLAPPPPNLSM